MRCNSNTARKRDETNEYKTNVIKKTKTKHSRKYIYGNRIPSVFGKTILL